MMHVARLLILFSLLIDGAALVVFFFTEQQGPGGYGTVLVYCSVAIGLLAGFSLMGTSTSRSLHGESLQDTLLDASARQRLHDDRESMLSYGLITFFSAVLSGLCGYALAAHFPS